MGGSSTLPSISSNSTVFLGFSTNKLSMHGLQINGLCSGKNTVYKAKNHFICSETIVRIFTNMFPSIKIFSQKTESHFQGLEDNSKNAVCPYFAVL